MINVPRPSNPLARIRARGPDSGDPVSGRRSGRASLLGTAPRVNVEAVTGVASVVGADVVTGVTATDDDGDVAVSLGAAAEIVVDVEEGSIGAVKTPV